MQKNLSFFLFFGASVTTPTSPDWEPSGGYGDLDADLEGRRCVGARRRHLFSLAIAHGLIGAALAACTVPNPNHRHHDASVDAVADSVPDAPLDGDPSGPTKPSGPTGPDESPSAPCKENQALRCDGAKLIRCNSNGSGELSESCSLGCVPAEKRCALMEPSNGLGRFMELASQEPDLNLGVSAKINTDTGDVTIDGMIVKVPSDTIAQSGAPTIRMFPVRSLTANSVVVSGDNALAIVSAGDIRLTGVFSVSSEDGKHGPMPGAGAGFCRGDSALGSGHVSGGPGGGGFGSPGGTGGQGSWYATTLPGAKGGLIDGNETLIPLRGGCAGGESPGALAPGQGGGAIQLVSRTQIVISGTIGANGSSRPFAGGGSGGGILVEAPTVEVSGSIFANGAGGGGCRAGEYGGFNTTASRGDGPGRCPSLSQFDLMMYAGESGQGGAISGPGDGLSKTFSGNPEVPHERNFVTGGAGGGGFGRIRINTAPGRMPNGGTYSPTPSIGTLAVH